MSKIERMYHPIGTIWACDSCEYKTDKEPSIWNKEHYDKIEIRMNSTLVKWCTCEGELIPYKKLEDGVG